MSPTFNFPILKTSNELQLDLDDALKSESFLFLRSQNVVSTQINVIEDYFDHINLIQLANKKLAESKDDLYRNRFTEEGVDEDPLAMKTENVQASISFKDRKGEFKSNAGESTVTFPVNQYVCKMDMFSWFMDKDELELEAAESEEVNIDSDLDFVGPNFFSINPKQDSLSFRAPKARFSLREKTSTLLNIVEFYSYENSSDKETIQ